MSKHWTKRQIDHGNDLIVDDTGDMIAITDARYVDLILASGRMEACLRRLWSLALVQKEFTDFCDEVVVQAREALQGTAEAQPTLFEADAAAVRLAKGDQP